MRQRDTASLGALVSMFLVFSTVGTQAADRIFLRNGDIIGNRSIVSFDEDSVRLDDGSSLGWHQIAEAPVAGRQAEFDRHLKELGEHLFRIRQRLSVGDYKDLLPHAEALYSRYANRQSQTAYTVLQALMWGKLAAGKREEALEPYLRCYALLRGRHALRNRLPGKRRLRADPKSGLTEELLPIWFDREAAERVRGQVEATIRSLKPRPPGALVYFAALVLAVGDTKRAEQILSFVNDSDPNLVELRQILAAQAEVVAQRPGPALARMSTELRGYSTANRPLAWYWLGMSKLAEESSAIRQLGLLDLLRIPATLGEQHPELAAAALYQSMSTLRASGDALGSINVRKELLLRYGQTSFADLAKSPSETTP